MKSLGDRLIPWAEGLGQTMRIRVGPGGSGTADEPQPREIVGVVADVAYPSFFTEKPAAVYVPFRQHVWQYGREDEWIHTRTALAVRASADPLALVRGITEAVRAVARGRAAHDFQPMHH